MSLKLLLRAPTNCNKIILRGGVFMLELTDEQKENLTYLRKMAHIVIPSEYTYWCHNTMYKPAQDCVSASDKRCWNEIPVDSFVIKKKCLLLLEHKGLIVL